MADALPCEDLVADVSGWARLGLRFDSGLAGRGCGNDERGGDGGRGGGNWDGVNVECTGSLAGGVFIEISGIEGDTVNTAGFSVAPS